MDIKDQFYASAALLLGIKKNIFTHISYFKAERMFRSLGNTLVEIGESKQYRFYNLLFIMSSDKTNMIVNDCLIRNLPTEQIINLLRATTEIQFKDVNTAHKLMFAELEKRHPCEFKKVFGDFIQ